MNMEALRLRLKEPKFRRVAVLLAVMGGSLFFVDWDFRSHWNTYYALKANVEGGTIGRISPKIRREGLKTYLWAKGDLEAGENVQWFDATGSELPVENFQYGIGKDSIPAIDDPVFLSADDPRIPEWGISDQTNVIGVELEGEARAYPIPFMNRHELVNDVFRGKPVTVGW